jgi:uncharacterized membrane protein
MDRSDISSVSGTTTPPPDAHESPVADVVWSYGGYRLEGTNFATALVHLYRGEITRANAWRNRLDVTTNWAVVATGAAISFAFAQPATHHSVIILITVLVTLFLFIEARRYRYYELWSYRIRLIETDFYGAMLVPPFKPRADWSKNLAQSLIDPQFPITMWEAFGRRLRRNYMWIYLVLGLAWIAKIVLFPEGITSLSDFFERSAMGALKGWIVILLQIAFYVILLCIGVLTAQLQKSSGEVLHRKRRDIRDLTSEIASSDKPSEGDVKT